jgi:F0F1-type ATP synthase alpha subunit
MAPGIISRKSVCEPQTGITSIDAMIPLVVVNVN